jgi:hypothetical protein
MEKKVNLFLFGVVLVLCFTFGFSGYVHAGENYGSHYVGGQEDLFMGFMGPPGSSMFYNYFVSYNATKLKDNAGRNATLNARTPIGIQTFPVDFKTDVIANALRFNHATHLTLFGGTIGWHVIVPLEYRHTSIETGPIDIGTETRTRMGDIEGALGIGWHPSKTFHHIAGLTVIAPTGAYYKDDLVNIGRNYWSINPNYIFSYIGDKDSPIPGLEMGAKLMYWFNTKNQDTSYTSGQEFAADYVIAQHLGRTWTFGANGTFLYQTTDDKQHGTAYDPFSGLQTGVKGRYFSIGPLLAYNFSKEGASISAKYQWDMWAHNRPVGNKLWVKFTWPF